MPELPEVHTTVQGLKQKVIGLKVLDIWTNYKSGYAPYRNQIKNPRYFSKFKKEVEGKKIIDVSRRHKNILIQLSGNKTILIHMKMTGHLMYGKYQKNTPQNVLSDKHPRWSGETWIPSPSESKYLWDPFNTHIRLVFSLSNKKHLVLSDVRKFAKITLLDTDTSHESSELKNLGPEPVEKKFTYSKFKEVIFKRPKSPIKSVLMDHNIVSGIGNIYSDEILFCAGVHPQSLVAKIPELKLKDIYKNIKPILNKGIKFGGDSTSDYRDIEGKTGNFQNQHNVYRKKGQKCPKKDGGIIERKVVGARAAHFCPKHQKLYLE